MKDSTPVRKDKNKEQVILEYAGIVDDVDVRKTVWLNADTLAFEGAEVEAAGQMLLKISCTSFQLY